MKLFPISNQVLAGGVVILLILALSPGIYFYAKYQKAQELLKNPQQLARAEALAISDKVGKLMTLPTDEEPTVATVTDKEKLASQPFFANAQNGDKVLIYTKARKAILYRPSLNMIIEVAPVSPGPNSGLAATGAEAIGSTISASASPTASPAASLVKLVLYNGTATVGITSSVEKEIKSKMSNVEVIDRDNAAKKTYTQTLIVDLTGKRRDLAQQIAAAIKGVVADLPTDEKKPEGAEILVIVGSDYIKE